MKTIAPAAPRDFSTGENFPASTLSCYSRYGKRGFDIGLSLLLLIFFLPLLLTISALQLSQGRPIFFVQRRIGRGGRSFPCLKFRTMLPDAETRLTQLLESDPDFRKQWETFHKLDDDPRITRWGQWLRRFSMDELPQLLNVLRGDMSLVGPRPLTPAEFQHAAPALRHYTALRPGITGLWQVSGRNKLSYNQRIALDRQYAIRLSFRGDLAILSRTIGTVLKGTGK